MNRRAIVLVDMPKLLREVVRGVLVNEPDFDVVRELDDEQDLLRVLDETGARHVVWGGDGKPLEVEPVLEDFPSTRVLAILADGRRGFLYRLRTHRRALGQLSPERLVGAIREGGT